MIELAARFRGLADAIDAGDITTDYRSADQNAERRTSERPPPRNLDEEVELRFTYHAVTGDQSARFIVIRAIAKELARAITRWCPPSRERELALTALDTVVMWANAAIARREA